MKRRNLDDELDIGQLPPIKRRERPFEYSLRNELKRRGIMFVKLKPTIAGFPDRLAIAPINRTLLVECKRNAGDQPDDVQAIVHRDLSQMGVEVLVVTGPYVQVAADLIELRLAAMR